jgi:hypothetical protein
MQKETDRLAWWFLASAVGRTAFPESFMDSVEEFAFIASQLEWLEQHLREAAPPQGQDGRMEGALNALACARAVIAELAHISVEGVEAGRIAQAA